MFKLRPVQLPSSIPSSKPLLPDLSNRSEVLPQTAVVRRSSVILVVALQNPVERFLLLSYRIVPMFLASLRHLLQAPFEPLTHRPHVNRELASSASFADVGKSKKIECPGFRQSRPF